ncbi:hypothetical protein GIB67_028954 [Kingdonia uniflora]|uniref:Aminotransferase-like plant mobile domain-containing protein n=1 Tax=Kingdonia uniflora TaxID=39325 RepID=A0A7J7LC39_9MAGN|nr:hypothetical protein GIB67_028954 [Kingdonia uniflora]
MAPKVARKKIPTRGKIVPTASLRKRINDEREDLLHPNYNNPPRFLVKRVKTCSTRVLVRDSSISSSVPHVSVTPEEDSSAIESSSSDSQGTPTTQSSTDFFVEHKKFPYAEVPQHENFHNPNLEQQRTTTTEEEVLPGDRNFEQGVGEYCPRDPSLLVRFATHRAKVLVLRIGTISYKHYNTALITAFCELWHPETNTFYFKWGDMTITLEDVSRLIGLRVDGDLTVMEGKWGAAAAKEILRRSMNLPDRVYPNLKAGGQGISFSLKKIVDFFAGKSWIFEHFPKLLGILTPNQSGVAEFCTRGSWTKTTSAQSGSAALNMFREALDSYKLQDVVWDPYLEKREDKHNFKEVASFTVSFTKHCLDVVNLAEDDDYDDGTVLGDRGGVSQRENVEVPHSQNEGGGVPARWWRTRRGECAFFMEANLRMQSDIQAKDVANSICEKKLNEKTLECESNKKLVEDPRMQLVDKVKENKMLSSINEKLMEEVYVNQEARPLPLNLVPHLEENVAEAEMWKHKYEELNVKFEEAQRRLSEKDRNGVRHLTLKDAIEGGDFEDTEDPTWEELKPNEVLECEGFLVYLDDEETFVLEEHFQSEVKYSLQ